MTPGRFTSLGQLDIALALLPSRMDTPASRAMLLAIGLQESAFRHTRQMDSGPARGFWQFEQGGGVRGVLRHEATREQALRMCKLRGVFPAEGPVWGRLEHDPVLACAFARLLLWSDPEPLPAVGDEQAAWALYLRTWRPGRPHPDRWSDNYSAALEEVPCLSS